jgi:hypothetical protein
MKSATSRVIKLPILVLLLMVFVLVAFRSSFLTNFNLKLGKVIFRREQK